MAHLVLRRLPRRRRRRSHRRPHPGAPVSRLRKLLAAMYGRIRLGRLGYVVIVMLLAVGGSYYQSSRAINALRTAQQSQCQADRDVADVAAAPVSTKAGKPSRILISYVGHIRAAYYGLHCPDGLKPPSPSFKHWARVYRVPYK